MSAQIGEVMGGHVSPWLAVHLENNWPGWGWGGGGGSWCVCVCDGGVCTQGCLTHCNCVGGNDAAVCVCVCVCVCV